MQTTSQKPSPNRVSILKNDHFEIKLGVAWRIYTSLALKGLNWKCSHRCRNYKFELHVCVAFRFGGKDNGKDSRRKN